jgi:hypothetical protein
MPGIAACLPALSFAPPACCMFSCLVITCEHAMLPCSTVSCQHLVLLMLLLLLLLLWARL